MAKEFVWEDLTSEEAETLAELEESGKEVYPAPILRGARTSVKGPAPDTHHGASEHQQLNPDAGTRFCQHCWSPRP